MLRNVVGLRDCVLCGIERSSKDVEIVLFNVCDCGDVYTTCNGTYTHTCNGWCALRVHTHVDVCECVCVQDRTVAHTMCTCPSRERTLHDVSKEGKNKATTSFCLLRGL